MTAPPNQRLIDMRTRYEARRAGFRGGVQGLPAADADLAPLVHSVVEKADTTQTARNGHARKRAELARQFLGKSHLALTTALLIAHLRKRTAPAQAAVLFQRAWAEQGAHLRTQFDTRWQISALATFGDHGATPRQRSAGLATTMLFNTLKLAEFERSRAGLSPDQPAANGPRPHPPLPHDLPPLSLAHGGLDMALILRLWDEAAPDPVIAPLAQGLLLRLVQDDSGLFHRLREMRGNRTSSEEPAVAPPSLDPAPPKHRGTRGVILPVPAGPRPDGPGRWAVVATVDAPPAALLAFTAHHLVLGAERVTLALDSPAATRPAGLADHPRVALVEGAKGATLAERQTANATAALTDAQGRAEWLLHLDHDEFLIAHRPVFETLAMLPPDAAWLRVPVAEALAPQHGPARHFRLRPADAGQPDAVLEAIDPLYAPHLDGGMLGSARCKVLARTGLAPATLTDTQLRHAEKPVLNSAVAAGLLVAHLHAPGWQAFQDGLETRRRSGGYRPQPGPAGMARTHLADLLAEAGDTDGLRALFTATSADNPALRARLAQHGLLWAVDLNLDAAVTKIFGQGA